jgi:ABC-type multidrug transport system permease subunit
MIKWNKKYIILIYFYKNNILKNNSRSNTSEILQDVIPLLTPSPAYCSYFMEVQEDSGYAFGPFSWLRQSIGTILMSKVQYLSNYKWLIRPWAHYLNKLNENAWR